MVIRGSSGKYSESERGWAGEDRRPPRQTERLARWNRSHHATIETAPPITRLIGANHHNLVLSSGLELHRFIVGFRPKHEELHDQCTGESNVTSLVLGQHQIHPSRQSGAYPTRGPASLQDELGELGNRRGIGHAPPLHEVVDQGDAVAPADRRGISACGVGPVHTWLGITADVIWVAQTFKGAGYLVRRAQ